MGCSPAAELEGGLSKSPSNAVAAFSPGVATSCSTSPGGWIGLESRPLSTLDVDPSKAGDISRGSPFDIPFIFCWISFVAWSRRSPTCPGGSEALASACPAGAAEAAGASGSARSRAVEATTSTGSCSWTSRSPHESPPGLSACRCRATSSCAPASSSSSAAPLAVPCPSEASLPWLPTASWLLAARSSGSVLPLVLLADGFDGPWTSPGPGNPTMWSLPAEAETPSRFPAALRGRLPPLRTPGEPAGVMGVRCCKRRSDAALAAARGEVKTAGGADTGDPGGREARSPDPAPSALMRRRAPLPRGAAFLAALGSALALRCL
mmetsp:Transcript_31348/g.91152  ORF Transcript_31348/g.91152 Transcript_31348/m.91152 type:complete len:322 (-) Transcript_31348:96-1061(-)